jgi:hypothetical protein
VDLPKKNPGSAGEIATAYLNTWLARGFTFHVCNDTDTPCLESAVPSVEDAVQTALRTAPIQTNVVFVKEAGMKG